MNTILKLKNNTFLKSELEMFQNLDITELKIKSWNVKYSTIEELYIKNNDYIDNLTL